MIFRGIEYSKINKKKMTEIILITVVLTLLSSGLIAFLVWVGFALGKLINFRKNADITLKQHEESVTFVSNNIYENIDTLRNDTLKDVKGVHEHIENVQKYVEDKMVELYNELDRKIDSRVDKLADRIEKVEKK